MHQFTCLLYLCTVAGESTSYAASFAFRTVNALKGEVDALSWWTFSSIFEEGGLPVNEFGPFGANSAMQTVHGIPLPIYRGFQLLASAGNATVPISIDGTASVNGTSTMLSAMATISETSESGVVTVYLANFAPDDGRGSLTSNSLTAPACSTSAFQHNVDYPGGDLLPEEQKFTTPNASACCEACKNFQVDKFCAVWSWGLSGGLTRCYLKSAAVLGGKVHHTGFTAGFPGAPPPPASNGSWYTTPREVQLVVPTSRLGGAMTATSATAIISIVNSTCANTKAAWATMGSPTWPNDTQLAVLSTASQVCIEHVQFDVQGATASIKLTLEAYAAVSITFDTTS